MLTISEAASELLSEERRLTCLRDYLLAYAAGDTSRASDIDAVERRLYEVQTERCRILHGRHVYCESCGEPIGIEHHGEPAGGQLCWSCTIVQQYACGRATADSTKKQDHQVQNAISLGHPTSARALLDMPLLQLSLVRHGHTEWNESGRCIGRADLPLSSRGREAVRALASHVDFSTYRVAYCSPARRAMETAHLLLDQTSASLRPRTELVEIDFGTWEGLTWREICLDRSLEWRLWELSPVDSAPYGGESLGEVAARMTSICTELQDLHKGESVLVVSHGGSLNVLLCQLFQIRLGVLWSFDLQPASVSQLLIYPCGPIVGPLSCSPHVQLAATCARAAGVAGCFRGLHDGPDHPK
jgi:broad specificity phosphatase PhoE